jgi:hypothetical protein
MRALAVWIRAAADDNSEEAMSGLRIFGVVLIILGVLGLVYGRFSYTKKSREADLGVMKLELKEKETVDIPTWAGVTAIGAGTVLLLLGRRR